MRLKSDQFRARPNRSFLKLGHSESLLRRLDKNRKVYEKLKLQLAISFEELDKINVADREA